MLMTLGVSLLHLASIPSCILLLGLQLPSLWGHCCSINWFICWNINVKNGAIAGAASFSMCAGMRSGPWPVALDGLILSKSFMMTPIWMIAMYLLRPCYCCSLDAHMHTQIALLFRLTKVHESVHNVCLSIFKEKKFNMEWWRCEPGA